MNMFSCLLAECVSLLRLMTHMSVETSFYGGDFIAMKTANEHIKGLRFKLWIMDIPLVGPTLLLYCEEWAKIPINTAFAAVHSFCCCINRSVLTVSSMLDFVLKNEANSIEYN